MSACSGDGQPLPTPGEFFEPSEDCNTAEGAESHTDASSVAHADGANSMADAAAQPVQCMPADFLLKAAARQGHRVPTDTEQQRKLLQKLTHLHVNGLGLLELHSLRLCPRLQVLYIYDNQLASISSIASSRLITHLYAQNNQLTSLEGLQELTLLQKHYLQRNALATVGHLTGAARLEELHVSEQHPQQLGQQHGGHLQCQQQLGDQADKQHQPGQHTAELPVAAALGGTGGLHFDPESLQAISSTLRVLSAAQCGIQDPAPLAVLVQLRTLDLANNDIRKLDTLQPVLAALQHLQEIELRGNPCLQHEPNLKYRDYIILLAADSLAILDGEAVPAAHRAFLLGLHLNKLKAQVKAEQRQQRQQRQQQQQQQGLEGKMTGEQQELAGRLAALPAKLATAAGFGACMAPEGSGVSLAGTGIKLQPGKAPAVRPTAACGFNVSSARIAAALTTLSGPK